jgi:uncharacterized protein YbaP (TraB family)
VTARRRAVLAALAVAFLCGPARAAPPMWRVTGPRGSAVLFGSIHLLPAGLAWRTAALTKALAGADELWFEIPIGGDDDARTARSLLEKGELPKGDSLAAHLPPALLRRLDGDAAALGLPPEALTHMRPWLADATLSIAADARSGALLSEGVERQIDAWTPPSAKRRALETAADQVAVLAGGSLQEQIDLLGVTLDEIEAKPDRYPILVDAWSRGDLATLRKEALDPLEAASPRAYRALITDRNWRWLREIDHRLRQGGDIVIVVGVGHLIGPDGLPPLLRADGLKVEGPGDNAPSSR